MDQPLRVLHLTAASDAGGVTRYLCDLGRAMVQDGHLVLAAGRPGVDHDRVRDAGITWLRSPLDGGPLALHAAARELRALLNEQPVDLIHAHYRRAALVGRRLARDLRLPLLFTLHLTGIPLGAITRRLSDWGDHAHAPSSQAGHWLIQQAGLDPDDVTVIPHGVPIERFPLASPGDQQTARALLGLPRDAVIGAYVGRFDRPKNVHWLVDVARRLEALPAPGAHLLLVGAGRHEGPLRRRIAAAGVQSRVTCLSYREPLDAYRAADALLLPSAREGFSLVCAEAMSVGRPVLRTRTAGFEEQIIEGRTGRGCPIQREAFVEAAVDFLADRARLRQQGAFAAEHVRTHLGFERQYARTLELYHRLIRP